MTVLSQATNGKKLQHDVNRPMGFSVGTHDDVIPALDGLSLQQVLGGDEASADHLIANVLPVPDHHFQTAGPVADGDGEPFVPSRLQVVRYVGRLHDLRFPQGNNHERVRVISSVYVEKCTVRVRQIRSFDNMYLQGPMKEGQGVFVVKKFHLTI